MTCQQCGAPITRRSDESPAQYARRRVCSRACAAASRHRGRTVVVEDLQWIIGTDHPDRVARRLGYANAHSLARVLHKWGMTELARRLDRVEVSA